MLYLILWVYTQLRLVLLLVADQASLICFSTLAVLHCIASLDCNAISLVKNSAPWTRNSSAVVVRPLALTLTNILELIATAVIVVSVPGSS